MKRTTFSFAGYLLLVALLARAMIPAGFMPARQGKPFALIICPGHMIGMSQPKGGHDHSDPAHQMPCAFSAAFTCGMIAHGPVPATVHAFAYRNVAPLAVHVIAFSSGKSFLSQGPPPPLTV